MDWESGFLQLAYRRLAVVGVACRWPIEEKGLPAACLEVGMSLEADKEKSRARLIETAQH